MIWPGEKRRSGITWHTAITSLLTSIERTWTVTRTPSWPGLGWFWAGRREISRISRAGNRAMNLTRRERENHRGKGRLARPQAPFQVPIVTLGKPDRWDTIW